MPCRVAWTTRSASSTVSKNPYAVAGSTSFPPPSPNIFHHPPVASLAFFRMRMLPCTGGDVSKSNVTGLLIERAIPARACVHAKEHTFCLLCTVRRLQVVPVTGARIAYISEPYVANLHLRQAETIIRSWFQATPRMRCIFSRMVELRRLDADGWCNHRNYGVGLTSGCVPTTALLSETTVAYLRPSISSRTAMMLLLLPAHARKPRLFLTFCIDRRAGLCGNAGPCFFAIGNLSSPEIDVND